MHVKKYDLILDVDFKGLKFKGTVLVDLESEEDIVLNAVGLKIHNISGNGNPIRFEQRDEDLVIKTGPFNGVLQIRYEGLIPDILMGIYRAPYDGTHMISTQFEAIGARRMFPCLDHPGYKAEFKLTVKTDEGLTVISNMPPDSSYVDDQGSVSFQKTPRMSTYLLYLAIGKFEEIRDKFRDIDLIAAAASGKASKGKYALDVTKKSIQFYEEYFGLPFTLPKLHLIAVPEFSAGAMENWGAITFREAALLVDENSSIGTRKRVAEVVAHELAHQWFGNLVTMKWWDDLWLNESFATFMSYKVVDTMYPQWRVWEDFLNSQTSGAMSRDSIRNTHPIEVSVNSPREIEQIFDNISYGKGASILRMMEAHMGQEEFMRGIMSYLKKFKFSNATGSDLWSSIEESSGKSIRKIMSEWIKKPGYPVVVASMSGGKLLLKQQRFFLSGDTERVVWPIPITMTVNGESMSLLFDKEEQVIDLKEVNSLKLNVDQTGFYRVHYEGLYDRVWKSNLSSIDRWGILSDALALLIAGKISFTEYIRIVERYYTEESYLPALEASDQLSSLYSLIPSRVTEASREFHRAQLRLLNGKVDENSIMLRGIMAARLARAEDTYARELGSRFRNYAEVEPDMRDAVAIAYARGYSDFDGIVKKYRESSSDEEKLRFIVALTSFKEASLVALSLGLGLSGEVKRQDVRTMILVGTANPDAREITWKWIKINLKTVKKLYEGTGTMSRILLSALPTLGIGRVDEVETFFRENSLPEAEKGITAGIEKLKVYDRFVRKLS